MKLDAGGQALLSSPHLIQTVAICDPTLTLGAHPAETACAGAGTLVRGIDAFFAAGYNPLADGLALDSLGRVVANIHRAVFNDDLVARREMMAAGLNSSLALQKGLCAIHSIANAVASVAWTTIEPTALGAILIPELNRRYAAEAPSRTRAVKRALGLPDGEGLAHRLDRLMDGQPLAWSLSELGVSRADLPGATRIAARDRAISNGPVFLSPDDVLDILSAVHASPVPARAILG